MGGTAGGRGWTDPTARPSIERWLPHALHGTDTVLVVEVVVLCTPAGELVAEVAALGVAVVVVFAGAVSVTVVGERLLVTVDVRLDFLFAVAEPPENLVGWGVVDDRMSSQKVGDR